MTRPSARGARIAVLVIAGAATAVAGCGTGSGGTPATSPAAVTAGSSTKPGPAVEQTRVAIEAALGARSIQVDRPQTPLRPAEAPSLVAAPRAVVQAVLPDDPAHGYISIYGFPDATAAANAAREQAAYVGSPIGRVQFPTGTQFVIRQVGPTVVFYSAVPRGSPDPLAEEIPVALETVGEAVPVPG